jgi:hypothetical protein
MLPEGKRLHGGPSLQGPLLARGTSTGGGPAHEATPARCYQTEDQLPFMPPDHSRAE